MDLGFVGIGKHHKALLYSYNRGKDEYDDPVVLKYETYDDEEHRTYKYNAQTGAQTEKSSVSISTRSRLKIKKDDIITLAFENYERKYRVTAVNTILSGVESFKFSMFPELQIALPRRVHLNKDDV